MKHLFQAALLIVSLLGVASFANATPISSTISDNFNGDHISGGDYLWFVAVVELTGAIPAGSPIDIYMTGSTITSSAFTISVPNSETTFSSAVSSASTSYSASGWDTITPRGTTGETLLDAVEYKVPSNGLSGKLPVTWTANFSTDTPGLSISWKWEATDYSKFNTNYNSLDVQAADSHNSSAGTPENYDQFLLNGGTSSGDCGGSSFSNPSTVSFAKTPEPSFFLPLGGLFLLVAGRVGRRNR